MSWFAVGLKQDVPPGIVIPSRIEDTALAIWCTGSGHYHAWSDRCPHRGMRLSHGFVRGERLACIYHGWTYDEAGACAYIPAHPDLAPPDTICVPSYPCQETDGVIWAALETPDAPPPVLADHLPVRSMPFARSAGQVAAHFGASDMTVVDTGPELGAILALQPCTRGLCIVHALAAPKADCKAVSRQLEDLRTTLEGAGHP